MPLERHKKNVGKPLRVCLPLQHRRKCFCFKQHRGMRTGVPISASPLVHSLQSGLGIQILHPSGRLLLRSLSWPGGVVWKGQQSLRKRGQIWSWAWSWDHVTELPSPIRSSWFFVHQKTISLQSPRAPVSLFYLLPPWAVLLAMRNVTSLWLCQTPISPFFIYCLTEDDLNSPHLKKANKQTNPNQTPQANALRLGRSDCPWIRRGRLETRS